MSSAPIRRGSVRASRGSPERALGLVASAVALIAIPATAIAHAGEPAVAYLLEPVGVGNVVDETTVFTWIDADVPIPTGTATVDLFYTSRRPRTFAAGVIPDDLVGEPIVQGLRERDPNNRYEWDVSNVPSGSYHIWSRVNEPPSEDMSIQIIHFAPGIVTVAHPGDPVYPAVLATSPPNAFDFADASYEITYSAFDPDGTARVKIEAAQMTLSGEAGPYEVLVEGLPAVEDGRWTWSTGDVEEGDWLFRLTIEDDRGLSFTTFSEFFLLITHPFSRFDAGVSTDAGAGDALPGSTPQAPSGGSDGCRCISSTKPPTAAALAWGLIAVSLLAARRRRREH